MWIRIHIPNTDPGSSWIRIQYGSGSTTLLPIKTNEYLLDFGQNSEFPSFHFCIVGRSYLWLNIPRYISAQCTDCLYTITVYCTLYTVQYTVYSRGSCDGCVPVTASTEECPAAVAAYRTWNGCHQINCHTNAVHCTKLVNYGTCLFFVWASVCLCDCASVCLSVWLCICLFVRLSIMSRSVCICPCK